MALLTYPGSLPRRRRPGRDVLSTGGRCLRTTVSRHRFTLAVRGVGQVPSRAHHGGQSVGSTAPSQRHRGHQRRVISHEGIPSEGRTIYADQELNIRSEGRGLWWPPARTETWPRTPGPMGSSTLDVNDKTAQDGTRRHKTACPFPEQVPLRSSHFCFPSSASRPCPLQDPSVRSRRSSAESVESSRHIGCGKQLSARPAEVLPWRPSSSACLHSDCHG